MIHAASSIISPQHAPPGRIRQKTLSPAEVKALIQQGLPSATVEVSGEDHTHFEALVVSPEFEGKRPLARHQMVYATLGVLMGREIHALSLRTLTPAEHGRG
jgi:acid stress-induced BolA-like protein IbaG/YrbA